MDNETRFLEAFPMINQRVDFLKKSCQIRKLMSALKLEFCKMLKVRKLLATSYHSQSLVKRLSCKIIKVGCSFTMCTFCFRRGPKWNNQLHFCWTSLCLTCQRLNILKEQCEEPIDEQASVLINMMKARERMKTVRQMLTEAEAMKHQKRKYDKNHEQEF